MWKILNPKTIERLKDSKGSNSKHLKYQNSGKDLKYAKDPKDTKDSN